MVKCVQLVQESYSQIGYRVHSNQRVPQISYCDNGNLPTASLFSCFYKAAAFFALSKIGALTEVGNRLKHIVPME